MVHISIQLKWNEKMSRVSAVQIQINRDFAINRDLIRYLNINKEMGIIARVYRQPAELAKGRQPLT